MMQNSSLVFVRSLSELLVCHSPSVSLAQSAGDTRRKSLSVWSFAQAHREVASAYVQRAHTPVPQQQEWRRVKTYKKNKNKNFFFFGSAAARVWGKSKSKKNKSKKTVRRDGGRGVDDGREEGPKGGGEQGGRRASGTRSQRRGVAGLRCASQHVNQGHTFFFDFFLDHRRDRETAAPHNTSIHFIYILHSTLFPSPRFTNPQISAVRHVYVRLFSHHRRPPRVPVSVVGGSRAPSFVIVRFIPPPPTHTW